MFVFLSVGLAVLILVDMVVVMVMELMAWGRMGIVVILVIGMVRPSLESFLKFI